MPGYEIRRALPHGVCVFARPAWADETTSFVWIGAMIPENANWLPVGIDDWRLTIKEFISQYDFIPIPN